VRFHGGRRRRRNPINQDELEDAGAAHATATAFEAESTAHGGRLVLYSHLSEIVEAHRYQTPSTAWARPRCYLRRWARGAEHSEQ
jgi:hypothetical protein